MTVVGGALFLVPFVILLIILGKALEILRGIVAPVAERIPIESAIGLETPTILAFLLLILLCLIAGLFARTLPAKKMVSWLETALLSNLPGYSFMKNLGEELAGTTPTQSYQSVFVRFDDAWQIGLLVERTPNGHVVVFIPGSPSPWSGDVYILDEDRVLLVDEATTSAVKCLQKLGAGAGELGKGKI